MENPAKKLDKKVETAKSGLYAKIDVSLKTMNIVVGAVGTALVLAVIAAFVMR